MTSHAYRPGTTDSVRPQDLGEAEREEVTTLPEGEGPEGPSRLQRLGRGTLETLQLIGIALLMAFVIKSFLLQAFYIPSGSMLDTLQINDRVLVEKVTFRLRDPQRGEIIVFRRPGLEDEGFSPVAIGRSFLEGLGLIQPDEDRDLIKRVIGLPGEVVELRDGVTYINGMPLEERAYTRPETRDFPPVRVPGGHYFVMGDNRGNSLDSRFTLGTIPRDNIIGRAFLILWPFSEATFALDQDYPEVGETPVPLGRTGDDQPEQDATADPSATPADGDDGF